jgi:hypothetical protein
MDDNKVEKYHEIDYTILKVCGTCIHARFKPRNVWGTCSKYAYDHMKHTDSHRQLSIYKFGTCPSAEVDNAIRDALGKYAILIKK